MGLACIRVAKEAGEGEEDGDGARGVGTVGQWVKTDEWPDKAGERVRCNTCMWKW